jgi:hypothetical protein
LKDFTYITDKAYTKEELLQMESHILTVLDFDFTFPTALRFLEKYTTMVGGGQHQQQQQDKEVMFYSFFLIEIALIDIRMLQYSPSVLAASALSLAYKQRLKQSNPQPE